MGQVQQREETNSSRTSTASSYAGNNLNYNYIPRGAGAGAGAAMQGEGKHMMHGHGNGNGHFHGRKHFSFDLPPTTVEEFQQLRKNILACRSPRSLRNATPASGTSEAGGEQRQRGARSATPTGRSRVVSR